MSDEQQGFGVSRTSIVSILVAGLLTGFYGQHLLLKDTRPAIEASNTTAPGLQQIDARLWEDPLFAAQQEAPDRSGKELAAETCASAANDTDAPTRTLLVIVPGGPYEQAAETRRRMRYAVISALHTDGYDPEDPEHLGCFRSSSPADEISGGKTPFVIPFELFATDVGVNPTRPRLSVVWVDENRLRGDANRHLQTLATIQQDFRNAIGLRRGVDPDVQIIGPYSSRVLSDLTSQDNIVPGAMRFRIFNYAATLTPSNTPASEQKDCARAAPTRISLQNGAVSLYQVIKTDDRLACILANEVRQRAAGTPRVALVYESDTLYGRKLHETVKAELERTCGANKTVPCATASLTYLRGLDGSLPSMGKAGPAASETQPAGDASHDLAIPTLTSSRPYQAAEGNSQLDYLEHLPGPLHQIEEQFSATSGPFTAIGLLGTDVYDKLLLLRALKPRFPNAVFFTTDLDARLFDPSEFPTTRGLIVASSFGLRPALDEPNVLSFRDSYQTAAFLATRLAVDDAGKDAATLASKPKLFEIGRWGAFPLRYPGAPDERQTHAWSAARRIGCLGLAIGGWLFLVLEFGLLRRPVAAATLFFLFGAGLFLLDAMPGVPPGLAKNILSQHGRGEPLSFTAGISLWPIIALRVLGVLFCIYAADRIFTKLGRNSARIGFNFNLDPDNFTPRRVAWTTTARTFMRGALAAARPPHTGGTRINPSIYDSKTDKYDRVLEIWTRLRPWDIRPRVLRSSIYTALSILTGLMLWIIFDKGYIPARGDPARIWYIGATILNVVAMQYLVMLVFDATSFSSYFVGQVRKVNSQWPDPTVTEFRSLTGIQDKNLLADWIDIQMIADRTQCIIDLIYFPFIALSIFTVSQTSVFDDVPPSIPVFALTTIGFGLLFYIAIHLRAEAEQIRRVAIEHFEDAIRAQSLTCEPRNLITCLAAIKAFRKGAFARLSQQPLVRAILLPLSSLGGSALLQLLLSP